MRLDCKGQPTYKYAGVGGALSATPLGPSGVLSVPYADLLHQVDPEGNYKAEAFRRYALFESVAALLKLATDRIGDESVEHLANQAQIYPSQTKIWEGGTKDEIQIFEALFKGVSTRFGLRTIEKSVENLDSIFCQTFQNLRLGSIKFRRGM
jgi:hypothetical protein